MSDMFQITGPESVTDGHGFNECRTYPIFVYRASWYVPEIPIPRWQGIIRIFGKQLWLAVAFSFILALVTFYLLSLAEGSWNFTDIFFDVVKSICHYQSI